MGEVVAVAAEGEEALEAAVEAAVLEAVVAEEWEAAEVRNTVRKLFTSFTLLKVPFHLDCFKIKKSSPHLDCWRIKKRSLPTRL